MLHMQLLKAFTEHRKSQWIPLMYSQADRLITVFMHTNCMSLGR